MAATNRCRPAESRERRKSGPWRCRFARVDYFRGPPRRDVRFPKAARPHDSRHFTRSADSSPKTLPSWSETPGSVTVIAIDERQRGIDAVRRIIGIRTRVVTRDSREMRTSSRFYSVIDRREQCARYYIPPGDRHTRIRRLKWFLENNGTYAKSVRVSFTNLFTTPCIMSRETAKTRGEWPTNTCSRR